MPKKKVTKKVAKTAPQKPQPGPSKVFYRIEPSLIGWVLITVEVDSQGKVVNTSKSDEDVLMNIIFQFEKAVKNEFNL